MFEPLVLEEVAAQMMRGLEGDEGSSGSAAAACCAHPAVASGALLRDDFLYARLTLGVDP